MLQLFGLLQNKSPKSQRSDYQCSRSLSAEHVTVPGGLYEDVIGQSVREAEERDLARALQNSRESAEGATSANDTSRNTASIPRGRSIIILPTDNFRENEVKDLVSLGLTREQVIAKLRRFNGDKTQATAALFAKALKF